MYRPVLVACFLAISGTANAQDETNTAVGDLKKAVAANTKAIKALTATIGRMRHAVVVQTVSPNPSLRECPSGEVRKCDAMAASMCRELGFQSGKAIQVWAHEGKFVLTNAVCTD